jgi:hypothetical protein
VAANAADKANRTLAKLEAEVAEILRQAAEIGQREGREHGPARGDELPAELADPDRRLARLRQAKAPLEAEAAERQRRYETRVEELAAAARAKGKLPRAHVKPWPRDEAPNPKATANVTDPDSRFLRTRTGAVQGYNAQAVVTEHQIVVAAELTQDANDVQQLHPSARPSHPATAPPRPPAWPAPRSPGTRWPASAPPPPGSAAGLAAGAYGC